MNIKKQDQSLTFRIHPSIGIARVGNSPEYYLAPETIAGLGEEEASNGQKVSGGLPIDPKTGKPVTSNNLRDNTGALKRQAARFRIFAYRDSGKSEVYPTGKGEEICIGSTVNGKKVKDIIWTVHLANKKANGYRQETGLSVERSLLSFYQNGGNPGLRNRKEGEDPSNPARIRKLVIDPGPRAIRGTDSGPIAFDSRTPVACYDNKQNAIVELPLYPKHFPADHFSNLYEPNGPLDSLGDMETDSHGRLIVAGGYGKASGWAEPDSEPNPLTEFVDNDGWFDDTSDGSVNAVIVLEDPKSKKDKIDIQTVNGAWVVTADPGFAPQTLNVVSLWDDMYDSWIRKMDLQPEIYSDTSEDGGFNSKFKPVFHEHIYPIFRAAQLQRWNTNLPTMAADAHDAVASIKAEDDPGKTILAGLAYIRDPNKGDAESKMGAPLMPLSLGDAGKSFLSPTLTQYFFLQQWNDSKYKKEEKNRLGPGEMLDKASLMNCQGGRFTPGIEISFIIRMRDLYRTDWQSNGGGPFRIAGKPMDYAHLNPTMPLLTKGYVPLQSGENAVEPGDICKFMAVPWQTDYNSCAIHTTEPNINLTLYWSWPSERPVAVYRAIDVNGGELGEQVYSVRGPGTENDNPALRGRFQDSEYMVKHWSKIGIIVQGTAIGDGKEYSFDQFLEVESQLDEPPVGPWPMKATQQEPA